MGVIDVSSLNPKLRASGGSGYNVLVDQLAVMENRLAVDGKLSPGDYDLLLKQARSLYASGALTNDQRSNLSVKISQYEKDKSVSGLKETSDIDRINRENGDDFRKNSIMFANNPTALITANSAAMKLKLDSLAETINQIEAAGGDTSQHLNEYSNTLNDYEEMLSTLDYVEQNKNTNRPTGNSVAYITTNSKGEINDIKIGRIGSQSGYVETNGLYGGLQIYGKINKKEDGRNIFQLGNDRFSATDLLLPDPSNPGAVKQGKLVSEDLQSQGGKGFDTAASQIYKVINPAAIKAQNAIGVGQWAQGEKGTLYQLGTDGKYKKYVNVDSKTLSIPENDILKVPRIMEAGINNAVSETAMPFGPGIPQSSSQPTETQSTPETQSIQSQIQGSVQQGGTPRTPAPQSRAPQGVRSLASNTLSKATGYLQRIFGG